MFTLIRNKITGEYGTIYTKEINWFKSLHNFFKSDPKLDGKDIDFNWDIVQDKEETQRVLNEYFTSRGRSEEYNIDLPSVTKIAYGLFPKNIQQDKFLLRWQNNIKPEDIDQQASSDILSKGTFCHFILEQFICDKEARQKDKPLIEKLKIVNGLKKPSKQIIDSIDRKIVSDIRRYIQQAYKDEEIIRKIPNLEDLKEELEFLATNKLLNFIKNELIFTDLVYSEIFIQSNDIQGSVDLVAYKNGKFSLIDYKTTSSLDKKTGKPKFKTNSDSCLAPYARQLYIYDKLLRDSKFSHCIEDEYPDFYIVQIHLLNGAYKKFNISKELVKRQGKVVEDVLEWYNNTRAGKFDYYNPYLEQEEYTSEDEEFVDL